MSYFLVAIFFETKIRKFWAKDKNSKSRRYLKNCIIIYHNLKIQDILN